MVNLTLAISLFVLSHLIPSLPGMRPTLIRLMGRNGYLATYGALSLVLLGWVFHAAISAPLVLVWISAGWQAWITLIVSPLGLFLIIAGLVSVNPLSLSARRNKHGRTPGAVVAITRHPVFWGLALWGASHIPPNGDVRSLLLFGTVAVLALSGFWLSDHRARKTLGKEWSPLARKTSVIPFVSIIWGRARLGWDRSLTLALALTLGMTAWLLLGGHAMLFGADPIAATGY